jgi:hypothetical protein
MYSNWYNFMHVMPAGSQQDRSGSALICTNCCYVYIQYLHMMSKKVIETCRGY